MACHANALLTAVLAEVAAFAQGEAYNLKDLAEQLDLRIPNHRAIPDVLATEDLFVELLKLARSQHQDIDFDNAEACLTWLQSMGFAGTVADVKAKYLTQKLDASAQDAGDSARAPGVLDQLLCSSLQCVIIYWLMREAHEWHQAQLLTQHGDGTRTSVSLRS